MRIFGETKTIKKMGYYTTYTMDIISGEDYNIDYEDELTKIVDYNPFGDETKWYGHHNDMIDLSIKHPNTTFRLEGKGEENGDMWKSYYKGGKSFITKAFITYEDYDESKLS